MKELRIIRKNTYNISNFLMYFILIPFLHPRGFDEFYSWYKLFFTAWLYFAMLCILLLILFNINVSLNKYKKWVFIVAVYYVIFIAITLIMKGGIYEGYQKLFAAPALCLFCALGLKNDYIKFLKCVSNILIINFILNITIFSPLLWESLFDIENHIIFIGHVQVAAQIGILGIYAGYILYRLGKQYRGILLIILSLINMIVSKTAASIIIIAVLVLGCLFIKANFKKDLLTLNARTYIVLFLLANALMFLLVFKLNGNYVINGISISLNGRMFIWDSALKLASSNIVFGSGAYGAYFDVFWLDMSDTKGMNYAHNEVIQHLLDGGIVLLLLFIVLLYQFTKNISKIKERKAKKFSNLCFVALLLIMMIESVTEYYFIFIFLAILSFIPEYSTLFNFAKTKNLGKIVNGHYIKNTSKIC